MDFVAYLSIQGYASSTIKSYVSAISFKCKMYNIRDETDSYIVKKMLIGVSRLDNRIDLPMPILLSDLKRIIQVLPEVCSSNYEAALFKAIFTMAFFGFFRVCELVHNSKV